MMEVSTPTAQAELDQKFGVNDYPDSPEDGHVKPAGDLPEDVLQTLDELSMYVPSDAKVTLARDREGFLFAMVEGSKQFDVLALTDDGRVGEGGINMPFFYDTVEEYLDLPGKAAEVTAGVMEAIDEFEIWKKVVDEVMKTDDWPGDTSPMSEDAYQRGIRAIARDLVENAAQR